MGGEGERGDWLFFKQSTSHHDVDEGGEEEKGGVWGVRIKVIYKGGQVARIAVHFTAQQGGLGE